MRKPSRETLLIIASVLTALLIAEIGLRVAERFGFSRSQYLAFEIGENFFFYHWNPSIPLSPANDYFDPIIGWKAISSSSKGIERNAQGWRSHFDYKIQKDKKRVIMAGDSFTFGLAIEYSQTITHHLQQYLGNEYEVMNMGGSGYGLDQISLVATEIAPKYHPDYLIIAFIGDDLRRSCRNWLWNAKKPRFNFKGKELVLEEKPLRNAEDNLKYHKAFPQNIKNLGLAMLLKIRLAGAVLNPILSSSYDYCRVEGNIRILEKVYNTLGNKGLVFTHLHEPIPDEFVQGIKNIPVPFIEMPDKLDETSKTLGIEPDFVGEGSHPGGKLNKIWAYLLSQHIINSTP